MWLGGRLPGLLSWDSRPEACSPLSQEVFTPTDSVHDGYQAREFAERVPSGRPNFGRNSASESHPPVRGIGLHVYAILYDEEGDAQVC